MVLPPALQMSQRALQATFRFRSHFLIRGGLVLGMLVSLLLAASLASTLGAPGLTFFRYLVHLDVAFLALVAVGWFSPILTEEKEAGTLSLLRLAGFRLSSVVLGKSLGAFLAVLVLVSLQLPFAALAATLGGISGQQILACYVTLGGFVMLCYGVAMVATVVSRTSSGAARLCGWVLAVIVVGPSVGYLLLATLRSSGSLQKGSDVAGALGDLLGAIGSVSPVVEFGQVLATGWYGAIVTPTFVTTSLLGGGLLLASLVLSFFASGESGLLPGLSGGRLDAIRTTTTRPGVRSRAIVWKDRYFIAGGRFAVGARVLVYSAVAAVCLPITWRSGGPLSSILVDWSYLTMLVFGAFVIIEAGVQAGRTYRVEEQDRTLFGLCLLPMRVGTWAYYKSIGTMWVVAVPLGWFALSWLIGVLAAQSDHSTSILAAAAVTTMAGLYLFCIVLILIHLTMLLSLYLARGAFPLALGAMVVVGLVMEMEYRLRQGCVSMLAITMLPFYALPLCGVMQTKIGRRLRELATR